MGVASVEKLICGNSSAVPEELKDEKISVLSGLGRLITSYYQFALDFQKDLNSSQASYFMPVALRGLMETTAIALLARVDPIRVIHSSKSQDSENYSRSRQQASGLKWKGDIVGDEGSFQPAPVIQADPPAPVVPTGTLPAGSKGAQMAKSTKAAKLIWDPAIGPNKIPRYLLSEQMWEAFWMPAMKNTTKWLGAKGPQKSIWITELMGLQPDVLHKNVVSQGNRIYSELSKGIHPEFAVRREAEFDAATLSTHFDMTAKWVATLGFISHFASGFQCGVSCDEALTEILEVEVDVNGI